MADALTVFERGGVIVYVLAVLSVWALAVTLLKLWQFRRFGTVGAAFVAKVTRMARRGDGGALRALLAAEPHPMARVMRAAADAAEASLSGERRHAAVARAADAENVFLQHYLPSLEVIANIAPLLGLLGTVVGMIEAFSDLEAAGHNVDPAVFAGGIWTSLLTTAAGLIVAIPSLAAFYMLDSAATRADAAMRESGARLLATFEGTL